jgi:hypothetical protein
MSTVQRTASPGLDSDVNLNLETGMATGGGGLIFRFQGLIPPFIVQSYASMRPTGLPE